VITGRAKARRDLRFDVFRGLAIYVITLNHSELLKVRVGSFYDCADLFIFISGFVCGMAYYRTAAKRGLRGLVAKAWRRSVQLALANVGVIGLVVSISLLAVWQLDIDPEVYRAGAIIDDPTSGLVEAFTFRSRLRLVDILVIYVLLLAWLPFAFFLYFKDRRIAVAVAVALYIYPIVAENFALPLSENLLFNVRFGHPLSWQLVFSIGLALGLERKRGTPFPVES
jgi:hypothetical protein